MLYSKLQVVNQHLEDGFLAGRGVVTLRYADELRHQGDVAELQGEVIVGVGAMEVGAAFVGVAGSIVEALHLIHIREDGVGILHHAEALIPEALHIVGIATASHTRGRCELGIEVVLETTTHIGLGIHTYIRHQVVRKDTYVVPVTIDTIGFQLLVTLRQSGLKTSLGAIGSCWLIE